MAFFWALILCLWISSFADETAFDCPMRQLALEFATEIQPWLSRTQLQQIADALNGAEEAKNCSITPNDLANFDEKKTFQTAPIWEDLNGFDNDLNAIYVDYINGNDKNSGTKLYPLKLLETALIRARKIYGPNANKMIILRKGKHYLPNTIYFNSNDNNTIITNYNNEFADLSGSIPINCEWKQYKQKIYSCIINNENITQITGLRVNGERGVRARYPNANPERDGFGSDIHPVNWFPSTLPNEPDVLVYPHNYPVRNDTAGKDNVYNESYFWYYNLGIGGPCKNFVPNAAYWCSAQGQGGYAGHPWYTITTGLSYNENILPNAPYKDPTGGIVQTWQCAHWATWMFDFKEYDPQKQTITFGAGGFQGGRGCGAGSNFYVDNIFEELDDPNEFYFDTKNRILYYYLNTTENINNLQFEVTNLKVLLNYSNINNITLRGLTIRDTAKTFMDDHGIPSGGDWALQKTGAIYIQNSENIRIESNLMTRLDGIGISINKYARNITVYKNEIEWTGASAITSWGDTFMPNNTYGVPDGMGYDGTKGTQPRYLNISYNYVHELGLWEKQASLYFQAKSCLNYIGYNIFYNGPRAGINFNDGFGGGSHLQKNLLFNTCRESGDHGPFNSWDRQVYVTSVLNGSPSVIKQFDYISQNFIIANYHSSMAIDNDDGSCYYHTHNNFLVYSPVGLKNNFGGHDNYHFNNIYGYLAGGSCFACDQDGDSMQLAGHNDHYYNNTCVINQTMPGSYGTWPCSVAQNRWPILGNNTIHILGNNTAHTGLCGNNEKEFQQKYNMDLGTQILGPVDDKQLLKQAHDLLWA